MRPRSVKRAAQERVYRKRRRLFLAAHPCCARCYGPAVQVHHMAARDGVRLLDESRWLPVCDRCHRWLTEHPLAALAAGLSLLRQGVGS